MNTVSRLNAPALAMAAPDSRQALGEGETLAISPISFLQPARYC